MIFLLNPDVPLKKFKGHLLYTNDARKVVSVDGKPVIVDNSTDVLATLESTDEKGLDLLLTIGDAPIEDGDESNFQVTADVDKGDGVKPLVYDIRIIWTRQATNVGLTFEEVTEA
jgi:hypothetical protein